MQADSYTATALMAAASLIGMGASYLHSMAQLRSQQSIANESLEAEVLKARR